MKRLNTVTLLLLAALFLMSCGETTQAKATTQESTGITDQKQTMVGKIAFLSDSNNDGFKEVCIIDTDGKNGKILVDVPEFGIADFSWSPDGEKIAYQVERWGESQTPEFTEIYVADADGSNIETLISQPRIGSVHCPTWSPDGTKIAYLHGIDDWSDLYVINVDGSNKQQLTNIYVINFFAWSSASDKMLYSGFSLANYGEGGTYLVDLTDLSQEKLFDLQLCYLSWQPNDRNIVYADRSGSGNNWDIFISDLSGTNRKKLVDDPQSIHHLHWNPEGTKIFFVSYHDRNYKLHIMDADGTNQKVLIETSDYLYDPMWSPNGTKIAFVLSRDTYDEIYSIGTDSSDLHVIARDNKITDPTWYPK